MSKKIDDAKIDVRSIRLNISRDYITESEYKDHLKSLPDLSKQADEMPVYEEEQEDTELTFSAG
jgi:hypothetical protein